MRYGCFRCGTINGQVAFDEQWDTYRCVHCGGHDTVLTSIEALDTINDAYLSGYVIKQKEREELEEVLNEEIDS